MTQTEFTTSGTGLSQADKILAKLKENLGGYVPMPVLALESGSFNVHSRIADLRKRGHIIEVLVQRAADGKSQNSFYRLVA